MYFTTSLPQFPQVRSGDVWTERLTLQLCEMVVTGMLQGGRPPKEAREAVSSALKVGIWDKSPGLRPPGCESKISSIGTSREKEEWRVIF
jgi:hypothetical protein